MPSNVARMKTTGEFGDEKWTKPGGCTARRRGFENSQLMGLANAEILVGKRKEASQEKAIWTRTLPVRDIHFCWPIHILW